MKAPVLGILYGMSTASLAAQMGCSLEQARRVEDAILGQFKRLQAWIDESIRFTRKHGYCTTWFAGKPFHRRLLWEIAGIDRSSASSAERAAFNTRMQGTGAALMLASLNRVVQWIKEDGVPARVVATIHDSMVVEAAEPAVPEVAWRVTHIMETMDNGDVPLRVGIKQGKTFGNMTSYTVE